MIKRLNIKKDYLEELKNIAKLSLPFEACAILYGIIYDDNATVDGIIKLNNAINSSIMFTIDPDELYKAYKEVRNLGKEIIGIFHSHPSYPKPSELDLKYMMINQIPWIILSTIDYSFEVYAYYNNKLEKLVLEVIE